MAGGVSTKGIYGVAASYYIYKNSYKGAIKSVEIAHSMELPQNYLEQILLSLKKGGVLKSIRGASGGYILARNSSAITVLQIIEVLEGDVFDIQLGKRECGLVEFWQKKRDEVKKIFDIPISELDLYDHGWQIEYII